jgi:hypothetical protein
VTDTIVWFALGGAVVSGLYGIGWAIWTRKTSRPQRHKTFGDSFTGGGLAAAFLFIALAGAISLLHDELVGDTAKGDDTGSESSQEKQQGGATADASQLSQDDVAAFRRHAVIHSGELRRPLCLVTFFNKDAEAARSSKWWTSCAAARRFGSIAEMREVMALPTSWKDSRPRDARVTARVPAGASITYLSGRSAAQCPAAEGRCYHGGGIQYRVMDLEGRWIDEPECLAKYSENAPLDYGPCK